MSKHVANMADVGDSVSVGDYSIVGAPMGEDESPGSIGEDVSIGSFCLIAGSAVLGNGVQIEHYCRVGRRTSVGANTQVLYSAQVFDDVQIGQNCIIAGELPNRTIVEDNVTFMGRVAHTYDDPTIPWGTANEPSPTIKSRSVIGVGAIIVGPVIIGPRSYVAAGEVVRHDIPADSVYYRGELSPLEEWRGVIKIREP